MIENHISSNVDNELFSESSELSTVKTAQLFSKHLPPSLPLGTLNFFFIKARILLQFLNQVFTMMYVFPIFFCFYKYFINFRSSKNLVTNKFFHWDMRFFVILLP